jgi:hypothetical protein
MSDHKRYRVLHAGIVQKIGPPPAEGEPDTRGDFRPEVGDTITLTDEAAAHLLTDAGGPYIDAEPLEERREDPMEEKTDKPVVPTDRRRPRKKVTE